MTNVAPPDNAVFLSPFAEALHGRRVGVSQVKVSEVLVGYTVLNRRFQRALERALKSFETYQARRAAEGWGNSSKGEVIGHLDDFLEAIYVAAELFEFYESDIVKLFNPGNKIRNSYRSEIRTLKRFSTLLCNKCKHNFAFLQCVEVLYDDVGPVAGFSVYRMQGEVAIPVDELHQGSPCFSLNWSFRRLLTDLMQADMAAAELVKLLPEKGGEPLASLTYTMPFLPQVRAIVALSPTGMPKEARGPKLTLSPDQFVNIEIDEAARAPHGRGKMRVFVDLISPSVGIRLPYFNGEAKVGIAHETNPQQPVPAFFRMVIGDLEVEDD